MKTSLKSIITTQSILIAAIIGYLIFFTINNPRPVEKKEIILSYADCFWQFKFDWEHNVHENIVRAEDFALILVKLN